jgi:hypothetical protein
MIAYEGAYNITIGGSLGHGNVIKNLGTTTADEDIALSGTAGNVVHDIIISYNHLYADTTDYGIDGIMVDGYTENVLIEYNSIHDHQRKFNLGEDGIDLKKTTSERFIIRYNNIYNHHVQSCIQVQSGVTDVYIYGNRCSVAEVGFRIGDIDSSDNIYIFSNLVYDIERIGILLGDAGSAGDVWVYNNTLAESANCAQRSGQGDCETFGGSDSWTNITINGVTSAEIKNNIIYKGRPHLTDYLQVYIFDAMDEIVDFDRNQYFWPSQSTIFHWGDAGYINLAAVQTPGSHGLPEDENSNDGDPGLVNIADNDYRIAGGDSAVVNAGEDMGSGAIATLTIQGVNYQVNWDDAIGPATVWGSGATLPVIEKVSRDVIGWDIGAYSFSPGGDVTAPVMGSPLPSGVQSCSPSNPRDVTLSLQTSDATPPTTCRACIDGLNNCDEDTTYDNMLGAGGFEFDINSYPNHSHVVSGNCGWSYTYQVRDVGNKNPSSEQIIFSITADATGTPYSAGGTSPGGMSM